MEKIAGRKTKKAQFSTSWHMDGTTVAREMAGMIAREITSLGFMV